MRSRGNAFLLPGSIVTIPFDDGLQLQLSTEWHDVGLEHELPGDLIIEAWCTHDSIDEALIKIDGVTQIVATALAFVANAPLGPVEVEIIYDSTPGLESREFRQVLRAAGVPGTDGRLVPSEHFM